MLQRYYGWYANRTPGIRRYVDLTPLAPARVYGSMMLGRVASAGGEVVMPKARVSDEVGYIAMFMDTEGNQIGLHSLA